MYNKLKEIAQVNGWVFFYGRRDFQNLLNEVEDLDKIYVFLDPVQIDNSFNEYNDNTESTHSGTFMLLKSSELGDGYDERYQDDIKPLIEQHVQTIITALSEAEYEINNLRTTEIINVFDWNYDGVVVHFSVVPHYH